MRDDRDVPHGSIPEQSGILVPPQTQKDLCRVMDALLEVQSPLRASRAVLRPYAPELAVLVGHHTEQIEALRLEVRKLLEATRS